MIKKACLSLGGLFLGFIICELLSRVFLPSPMFVDVECENEGSHISYFDVDNRKDLYYFTGTGWALRENCTAKVINHYISGRSLVLETDTHGFRKSANRDDYAPGAKTVLFIGDSITLADYLEDGFTIPDIFQEISATKSLAAKSVNAGVATAGLSRELEIIDNALTTDKPDLILVNFFLNDVRNCCATRSATVSLPWRRSYFISQLMEAVHYVQSPVINFEINLTPQELNSWRMSAAQRLDRENMKNNFRKIVFKHFDDWGNAWSDEAWERMKAIIAQINTKVVENRVNVGFVAYPVTHQIVAARMNDFPQRELEKILKSYGIPILDLLPLLRDHYKNQGSLPYFDAAHPNEEGNRLIAQAILDFVEKNRLFNAN